MSGLILVLIIALALTLTLTSKQSNNQPNQATNSATRQPTKQASNQPSLRCHIGPSHHSARPSPRPPPPRPSPRPSGIQQDGRRPVHAERGVGGLEAAQNPQRAPQVPPRQGHRRRVAAVLRDRHRERRVAELRRVGTRKPGLDLEVARARGGEAPPRDWRVANVLEPVLRQGQ